MVSSERRFGSLYFFWMAWICGCVDCIAREAWSCCLVSGQVMARMISVKMMIAMPKLPNEKRVSNTSKLVCGTTNTLVQSQPISSKRSKFA